MIDFKWPYGNNGQIYIFFKLTPFPAQGTTHKLLTRILDIETIYYIDVYDNRLRLQKSKRRSSRSPFDLYFGSN